MSALTITRLVGLYKIGAGLTFAAGVFESGRMARATSLPFGGDIIVFCIGFTVSAISAVFFPVALPAWAYAYYRSK